MSSALRTVPGSIPGGVTGDFFVVPPTEPCALRSNQPLKVSTRDFSWGKGGRCVWQMTYHSCNAETSRNPGPSSTPNPLGHLGLSRDTFTLLYIWGLLWTDWQRDRIWCEWDFLACKYHYTNDIKSYSSKY